MDDVEQNERIRILDGSFAESCRQADARYVPVYEPLRRSPVWMSEVAASDGAHPAADGYQALTDVIVSAGWVERLARQGL